MKLVFFTIFTLFINVVPGYPVDWEFVTSATTYDGIDISYFIDTDEIKIMDGIRSFRQKRVYTRGKSATNIGIVQIRGYYDCTSGQYVNGSISFLSPEGKYLQGSPITGSDYTWQIITPGANRLMYEYVCKFYKR